MYPGDKIILQKDQVRPIRQPGGYYSDLKIFSPNLALLRSQGISKPVAQKPDKLSVGPLLPCLCSCPTAAPLLGGWGSRCASVCVLTWHVQPN